MVASTYDDSLRRLLQHEGGYTNHPSDPGGPTNFGITIIDYRKYVKPNATAADVKTMTLDEAKKIYRAKYWNAMRCDELPAGVDYCVFDYGVNSGTGRAPKVLQRVVGAADDGRIGPATLAAVRARDPKAIVAAICDERLAFLQRLKSWPVFGKGWGRRVSEVRAAALGMASKAAAIPEPAPALRQAGGKAAVPVNSAAQQTTAGSAVAGGAAASTQGSDATTIILILAAAVVLGIAGWIFWRWRQRRQQEAAIPGTAVVPALSK